MLSVANVSPNFGSTKIKMNEKDMNMLSHKVMDKYVGPVKEHFNTRAALLNWEGKPATPQMVADDIRIGEAAVKHDGDVLTIYGKDEASDSFIGKLLTKLFPENTTFTKDIK